MHTKKDEETHSFLHNKIIKPLIKRSAQHVSRT